ncbi:hypothetical protein AC1031_011745 [Aphanomyces cochlioides]|nr:hypothetical protein AC1031_011745 [Aphanomyces cochlioides]
MSSLPKSSTLLEDCNVVFFENDGKVSLIVRDDLARAAAYGLASDNTDNITYEWTGPEALSMEDIVAQISETGRSRFRWSMCRIAAVAGLPSFIADALAALDESTATGVAGDMTDDYDEGQGAYPPQVA